MEQTDIIAQLGKNIKRNSALETLMQIDGVLESLNVYAYKNWIEGEIVDGPQIERYWVTVTLLYPYKMMPDPTGAERLIKNGCKVYYAKDTLTTAAKLIEPEDSEIDPERPNKRRAKKILRPVWLVTLEVPRGLIDTVESSRVKVDDMQFDSQSVEQAYDDNLGDDDEIISDET